MYLIACVDNTEMDWSVYSYCLITVCEINLFLIVYIENSVQTVKGHQLQLTHLDMAMND